ncbi:cysteine--tRNA ligase [Patescibacteria group bacterium]|nr:cysteine--tRNA ligase [Patescibacteria group bacterium]
MAVKFYNFLIRKKETFKSLRPKQVGFYACGPTVYDYAHIGNLRTYIFEDILKRTLEYNGYKVNLVVNITDVEDKIIRESQKTGKSISDFVKPYEKAFFEDLKKLNIEKAWKYPKATKHIKDMIKLIAALLKNGLAYETGGSVYFDISKFKSYGKLSGLSARSGSAFGGKNQSRIDSDEYDKTSAEDFVLWKVAKNNEPLWDAPFGKGRPGWHIECSAMSMKYLGNTFDIHGGAVDLIFPHHENEIAQSEGATGKTFVKYFIEGEHLSVNGEKMSKSLGNIFNLRDLEAKKFDPLAFRYLSLTAHYRSKLNFTWESLQASQNALEKLREAIIEIKNEQKQHSDILENVRVLKKHLSKEFEKYINDDLDMPRALALLWEIVKSEKLNPKTKYNLIIDFDKVLGLNLGKIKSEKIPVIVLKLVKEREKCRQEKNFTKSDELRKKIESLGWLIDDSPSGPKLKKN